MTNSFLKRSHLKPKRAHRAATPAMSLTDFAEIYRSTPDFRVKLIRRGVPASELKDMARIMDIPQDRILKSLKMSIATVNRKANLNQELSSEDSERVVGMSNLIGQVETMVKQSGDAKGFDAAKWVGRWLEEPLPALGGARPAQYMDTMEGQKLVSNLLAMVQSGAYA